MRAWMALDYWQTCSWPTLSTISLNALCWKLSIILTNGTTDDTILDRHGSRLPWGKDRQRASMLTRRWSIIWQYIRCNCVANSQVVPYFFVWILNSLQLSLSRVYTLELINSCFCSVTTFFTSCCFEVAISYMLLSYSIYYTKPYCCLSTCKLYVTDYITYKVWVMSASGEIITTFGGEHLSNPEGITIKFWFMCFILSMQSM